uniref:Transport permease protein n=1 Tax=Desulfomonile tiedjei TaxID=2358 RepID=A0A7C4ASR0_9BACT
MASNLYNHRNLIRQFAWRDVVTRYKGSYFGMIWSFVTPLMLLAVFSFVFSVIFKSKWGVSPDEGKFQFAMTMFCGMTVFNIFGECISRAPTLILQYPNYVKKVVFPLEILPVAALGSSLINAALSLAILIPAVLLFSHAWPSTIYLFPLVLIPICAFALGFGWFLASMGVFIRDIAQPVSVIVQMLFFISGIFFPPSAIPEEIRSFVQLNPLVGILEDARRTLMWGQYPDWSSLALVTLFSLIVMQLGYLWFMRTKRAFADVI